MAQDHAKAAQQLRKWAPGATLSGTESSTQSPQARTQPQQGANPSAPAKNGQSSLLMLAIKAQSPELIARLTPSADLGETDRNGLTALHHFISSIHTPPAMGSELFPALRSLITPSSATTRSLIGFSPLDAHAQRAQGSPPFHSDDTFASIVRELLPFSANSALDGYKACVAALDSNRYNIYHWPKGAIICSLRKTPFLDRDNPVNPSSGATIVHRPRPRANPALTTAAWEAR